MKFVYIFVAVLILAVGGYFAFTTLSDQKQSTTSEVPEGFHRMSDGTLMKNVEDNRAMELDAQLDKRTTNSATPVTSDEKPQAPVTSVTSSDEKPQASVTIDPNARVFAVKGVNYGYDVKEIRVKQGDTVTIQFESTDGFHDWVVDEFKAATSKVQPGVPTSVTFVADKSGTFEYYCSVGSHRSHGMVGKLIVE